MIIALETIGNDAVIGLWDRQALTEYPMLKLGKWGPALHLTFECFDRSAHYRVAHTKVRSYGFQCVMTRQVCLHHGFIALWISIFK